ELRDRAARQYYVQRVIAEFVDKEGVDARTAIDHIGAVAGRVVEEIVAVAAEQRVVAAAADDLVVARAAGNLVVALLPENNVVAVAAVDDVVATRVLAKGNGSQTPIGRKILRAVIDIGNGILAGPIGAIAGRIVTREVAICGTGVVLQHLERSPGEVRPERGQHVAVERVAENNVRAV